MIGKNRMYRLNWSTYRLDRSTRIISEFALPEGANRNHYLSYLNDQLLGDRFFETREEALEYLRGRVQHAANKVAEVAEELEARKIDLLDLEKALAREAACTT